jgi:hypothetical protein
MDDTACLGGAVAVDYGEFRRWWMRFYVLGWKLWEWIAGTRQGATQFCRRDVFEELGGYDESIYLGEDVEFQWRLARLAKARGGRVAFITDPKVSTSPRRFDRMSAGKILLLTNPLFIFLTWRNEKVWKDWYEDPIR